MESAGAASTGVLVTALLWLLLGVVVLFVVGVSVRLVRARATERLDARRSNGGVPLDAWQEAGRRMKDSSHLDGGEE